MKSLMAPIVLLIILGIGNAAQAGTSSWASVGTGCLLYDGTTTGYAQVTSAGAPISNISGKLAVMVCPVLVPADQNGCPGSHGTYHWSYNIYSVSSSQAGTGYGGITPYLLRSAKGTGVQSTVLVGTTYQDTTYAPHSYTMGSGVFLDFDNYFYWAEVYLDGSAAHPTVQNLYAAELVCVPE